MSPKTATGITTHSVLYVWQGEGGYPPSHGAKLDEIPQRWIETPA
jgi:hypothetical protein